MATGHTLSYLMPAQSLRQAHPWQVSRLLAGLQRPLFLAALLAGAAAGRLATGHAATDAAIAGAGPELTRLLRAMAGLKLLFVAAAVLTILWRLDTPATWWRWTVYALAGGAMAAGPGLIWGMAHVEAGAVLLHAGLLASLLVLWRDPGTAARLAAAIKNGGTRASGLAVFEQTYGHTPDRG